MAKQLEYRLNILQQFKCIGEKCPQNCCTGPWNITLSPETASLWKTDTDKPELADSMEAVDAEGGKIHVTKKNPSTGHCILLTDEGLCGIQSRYGVEYMPDVCVRFPRFTRTSAHFQLHSAWLSCPEIARLALLEHDPRKLLVTENPAQPIGTMNPAPFDTYSLIVHWLSKITAEILAHPKYTLGTKIYSTAWFCGEIHRSLQKPGGPDQDLIGLLKKYKNQLYSMNLKIKQKKLHPDPCNAVNYWKAVTSLIQRLDISSDLIEPETSDLWVKLSAEPANETEYHELFESMQEHRQAAKTYLQTHHRHILENYLRLVFTNAGFPWDPEGKNHVATFLFCIIPFSIVMFLCWALYEKSNTISSSQLLALICMVEAKVTHNNVIYDTLAADPGKYALHRYADVFIDLA